jgi:hypothetical protein
MRIARAMAFLAVLAFDWAVFVALSAFGAQVHLKFKFIAIQGMNALFANCPTFFAGQLKTMVTITRI